MNDELHGQIDQYPKPEWEARVYKKANVMTREEQKAWRSMRRSVLTRDKHSCRRCGKKTPNGRGLTVHHIIPRDEGGPDDSTNLITLCQSCHDYVEVSGLRLLIEVITIDDEPVPTGPIQNCHDDHGVIRPEWHKYVYGGVHRG